EDYEHHLIKDILYKNLTKIPVGTFEQACETVVKNSSHKVHRYTHKLLRDLKAKGYEIIAISGSQQELLDRFCARYDFDVAIGAMYERKDGYFTGQISRMTVGNKAMILRKLINARNLSLDQSIAIGDSDGDIDILALVEQPIAFNPSQGLFDHAKAAGWPIVIERKNMAYKLEGKDGRLVLAEAIAL
ncbi:MAG TPA: HAD-IB family phosphatase, partial [Candidatus Saccharimonadales bacterium]|nr:HAD-IB family phosphatase [Candidatus Saccharimonadales bacterium]